MKTTLVGALLAALSLPALAADRFAGIPDEDLHMDEALDPKRLGSAKPEAGLSDLLASCDGGRLRLPKRYGRDYSLTSRDKKTLDRMLAAAGKYLDIEAAFRDGYVPDEEGYDASFGVTVIHPGLFKDGKADFDRPDGLGYVKRKGKDEYMLAGLVYYAGGAQPPAALDFGPKSKKKGAEKLARTGTWDFEDDVCLIERKGKVGIYMEDEVPKDCDEGEDYEKLWRLYAWPVVYNPQGLFFEDNPLVDHLDLAQELRPLCPPAAR